MKIVKKIIFVTAYLPFFAFAQAIPYMSLRPGSVNAISTPSDFNATMGTILQFFGSLVFAVSVFIFLYAGFLYVTAGDNEDNVSKAKSYLTYGIVGLIVALLAYSIPLLVSSTTQLGGF